MHDYRGCSIDSLPWALCTQEDYESACRACEQEVVVSRAQIQDMKPYLDYDKKKNGSRGRALLNDFVSLGLGKGDRLEPCESLRDVSLLESVQRFPLRLVFWRRARETRTRHSNPLLLRVRGVSIRSFRQDLLCGLYLSIGLNFCCSILRLFVNENVFATDRTQHTSL